ncbi:hypothetical protein BST12_29440, partial [Mycobacterium angelicum]
QHLAERARVDQLRYQVSWRAVTPASFPATRPRWLVLTRPEQAHNPWLQALVAAYPDGFSTVVLDMDHLDRDQLAALLIDHSTTSNCDGVLSLLALPDSTESVVPGPAPAVLATLALVQAYGDSALSLPLWVVTHGGAQLGTDDSPLTADQAAVWGLGQSVCLE